MCDLGDFDKGFYGAAGMDYRGFNVSPSPIMWIGFNPPCDPERVCQGNKTIAQLFFLIKNDRYFWRSEDIQSVKEGKGFRQKLKIANLIDIQSPNSKDLSDCAVGKYNDDQKTAGYPNYQSIVERAKDCSMIICGWGTGRNDTVNKLVNKIGEELLDRFPLEYKNSFRVRALFNTTYDRIGHPIFSASGTDLRVYSPLGMWEAPPPC